MPRLNSEGRVAMGVGGHQGSINGTLIHDSYGPQWYNDFEVIFAQPSDQRLVLMDALTFARRNVEPNHPSNSLYAGGSNWAAWANLPGIGLFAPNLHLPDAGLLSVGPDGAIGFRTQYHSNTGVEVVELNGQRWTLNNTDIMYDLQLLGARRAIWKNIVGHRITTYGLPVCVQVGGAWGPKAAFLAGEWWVCYWSDLVGVVLHPFNSTVGYIIVPIGINAYGHDFVPLGDIAKIAWSERAGELPEDYRQHLVNILTSPRQQLIPHDPIVRIDKPCWMTWFEFNGVPPGTTTPWNAQLKVIDGGPICDSNDVKFAQWIQGDSVIDISNACINNPSSCVAYWDSRNWPNWPIIKPKDWLALQAYCLANESLAQFEGDMRKILNSIPEEYNQIALVCQCYSSNVSLTTDLKGVVSVYARLARDYPRVNHLLAFSDKGRATGLNDHPELVPYWTELFAGITGVPGMTDMTLPLEVWDRVIIPMHERYAQEMIDLYPNDMERAAREWMQRVNEQVLYSYPDEGYCWKSADPNRPPSKDTQARILDGNFFGWDLLQASSVNGPKDLVEYPPAVNDLTGQHPIHPGDPLVPNFQPTNWLDNDEVIVDIHYFDSVVGRSNPYGMLIRFDVSSENPIIQIEVGLDDDGEPSIVFNFLDEERRDGRYARALAFKPTVEGTWPLKVRALDNQGNIGESIGTYMVTVVP